MGDHLNEGFEVLEHTADVGIRARGQSLPAAFRNATLGLLDIVGAWRPGPGERHAIEVEGRDLGAVLVDWLGEVLYLQDTRDVVVTEIEVSNVEQTAARGWVEVVDRTEELEGTAVKAITLHQLAVEKKEGGWVATVYLDI
jgi:SHS2 domain-containing protein